MAGYHAAVHCPSPIGELYVRVAVCSRLAALRLAPLLSCGCPERLLLVALGCDGVLSLVRCSAGASVWGAGVLLLLASCCGT